MTEALQSWRSHLTPMNQVKVTPPQWVLPKLLPPGMTLLFGDPKTYKSLLVLHMIAAIVEGKPVAGRTSGRVPKVKGTALYFAAEQSAGRLRDIYETRVLRRSVDSGKAKPKVNFDFCLVRDPWEWKLEEAGHGGERDMAALIQDLRPTLVVIDPLVYFHEQDENDPKMVRFILPVRKAVMSYGGSLVLVHHARKASNQPNQTQADWSRVRGTSALWAMADAGIQTNKVGSGSVNITCEFKDWPSTSFTWRPV